MAHDVFISYSSKDKQVADAACAVLESRSIRCWIAPRDILPGGDWAESIVDAIRDSRVMVLIFSSNANQSVQIKREVERAVHHGLSIIPLRIEDVAPTGALEYAISAAHWLDAFTPPMERHLHYLADVVKAILTDKPKPRQTPPPRPLLPWWSKYAVGTAAVLLLLLCLFWGKLFPASVQGDWNMSQCTLAPGQSSVGTDFISTALNSGNLKGELHVKDLDTYSASFTATDSGTIVIDIKSNRRDDGVPIPERLQPPATYVLTFTSNSTHKPIVMSFTKGTQLTPANSSWGPFGIPAGDEALFLNDGNPSATGITLHREPTTQETQTQQFDPTMVGTWAGTPFNIYPPNSFWSGTLEIRADKTYLFTLSHTESGILDAKDGTWSGKPSNSGNTNPMTMFAKPDGLLVSGHYSFAERNRLQIATERGSFTFDRQR